MYFLEGCIIVMRAKQKSKAIDHTKPHLYEVLDENHIFKGWIYSTKKGAILKAQHIDSRYKVTGRAVGKCERDGENRGKTTKKRERIYS